MQITADHKLTVNETTIDLPALSVASTLHVWSVPADYRANGYFVSAQVPGQPQEIPACSGSDAAYLGSLPLEADAGAVLAAAKDAACDRIETARRALETAGVTIKWPDGTSSKIQTRDERDWRNINGVAARGLARLMQATTDEDWFRDADDKNHTLLPTQAVDMGYQAAAAISRIAKVAQDTKDDINEATDLTGVAAIEAAVVWPS